MFNRTIQGENARDFSIGQNTKQLVKWRYGLAMEHFAYHVDPPDKNPKM